MSSTITVKNKDGVSKTVTLPVITNIEDIFNVMLTETSTIIYGFRNRFVMDMGTKRSFTLTCERVNPPNYNDSSLNWDDWSNGKWMTEFIALLDPWQNMMGQQEGDKKSYVGGFTLNLDSCDTTLFPKRTFNVFLNGSISPTYGVQVMKFTLPLSVGRMTGTDAKTDFVTVTLHANDGTSKTFTQSYPRGSRTAVPSCPASWVGLVKRKRFYGWNQNSTSGALLFPGTIYQWNSDVHLYVNWKGRIGFLVRFENPEEEEDPIYPPSGTNRCTAYIVGAGGGGGSSGGVFVGGKGFANPGGAGAGGEMITTSFSITPSVQIEYTIGEPGEGKTEFTTTPKNGGDGGDTILKCGNRTFVAHGGEGGQGASPKILTTAQGGQKYYAGGGPREDGKTDNASETPGIYGHGGTDVVEKVNDGQATYYGGGGGGAPPLNHEFLDSTTYSARGGNGKAKGEPSNGIFGGGGGTSGEKGGADGGGGFLWIDFFE